MHSIAQPNHADRRGRWRRAYFTLMRSGVRPHSANCARSHQGPPETVRALMLIALASWARDLATHALQALSQATRSSSALRAGYFARRRTRAARQLNRVPAQQGLSEGSAATQALHCAATGSRDTKVADPSARAARV